jgi:hypothetical protein
LATAGTFQYFLGTWHRQSCRLFYQTFFGVTPSVHALDIYPFPATSNAQAIANALLVLQGCVKPAPGEAQAIPNAKVYSQNERTIAQAIYNHNMKSDDNQTVKTTTQLAIG